MGGTKLDRFYSISLSINVSNIYLWFDYSCTISPVHEPGLLNNCQYLIIRMAKFKVTKKTLNVAARQLCKGKAVFPGSLWRVSEAWYVDV